MRTYILEYAADIPSEKVLNKIRNFAGIKIIYEIGFHYSQRHSIKFEHENNYLSLNTFKLRGPWVLYRGDIRNEKI